jgi:CBS domain containing-hemolysin-like protein
MTYIMLGYTNNEYRAELLACLVSTPIFFVFSELIPKNLFYHRADYIMPLVSPVVFVFHRIASYTGLVWLMKTISSLASFSKGEKRLSQRIFMATAREHFEAVLLDTNEEKILSPVQTDMIWRLRSISRREIQSVMTPLSKIEIVNINAAKADLLSILEKHKYSRYLVYENDRSNIVGFINIYDCLNCSTDFSNLRGYVQPIYNLDCETTVLDAISIMEREKQKIMLAAQTAWGKIVKPLGIITMKDLAEELLGELGEW